MSRPRKRIFRKPERDDNELQITAVLDAAQVRYERQGPGAGFDLLVMIAPMECWEVKNPSYKWSLTEAEKKCQAHCKDAGIVYRIIETMEQAVKALPKPALSPNGEKAGNTEIERNESTNVAERFSHGTDTR